MVYLHLNANDSKEYQAMYITTITVAYATDYKVRCAFTLSLLNVGYLPSLEHGRG